MFHRLQIVGLVKKLIIMEFGSLCVPQVTKMIYKYHKRQLKKKDSQKTEKNRPKDKYYPICDLFIDSIEKNRKNILFALFKVFSVIVKNNKHTKMTIDNLISKLVGIFTELENPPNTQNRNGLFCCINPNSELVSWRKEFDFAKELMKYTYLKATEY